MFSLLVALFAAAQAPAAQEVPLWQAPAQPVWLSQIVVEGADFREVEPQLEGLEVDAPLVPRAVRAAVRLLHTTRRFAAVAAFVEPVDKPGDARRWVRLILKLTPTLEVRSVSFPGRSALPEASLRLAANLSGAFHPSQLPRAAAEIKALYARSGYPRATVTPKAPRAVPGGVAIELDVDEGEPTRVASVRFEGEPALQRDALMAAFRLRRGDVWNLAAGEEGVRALRERYKRAGRLRARVDAVRVERVSDDRVRPIVPVRAGPRITFHVRGNRFFEDRVLLDKLSVDGDEPLDAQGVQEMAARLRRFYVSQGFLYARLLTREFTARDGTVQIFFSVAEGKPVRVERIAFDGNKALPDERLVELVEDVLAEGTQVDPATGADPSDVERTGVFGRPSPAEAHKRRYHVNPSTVFDPVLYARAIRQIEDLYKSEGFLNAQVGSPKVQPLGNPNRIAVTIPVREGEQARVLSIRVEGGASGVANADIARALSLSEGKPFSYLAAEESRGRMTALLTGHGYLYAKVEDDEQFDEPRKLDGKKIVDVRVTYRIQPGPLVRVSLVKVESPEALNTVEGLVLDLVAMKEGDVLTPATIDRAQQALLQTGLFFSATLTPVNPDLEEPKKVVQVSLRERPTQSWQTSVGFSLNDGPRGTVQYQKGNLFGKNVTFSTVVHADFPFLRYTCTVGSVKHDGTICDGGFDFPDGRLGALERVIDVGLSTQRFYPVTDALRGGVDLIHERATRPSYNLTKYSGQLSVDTVQRRPWSLGLAIEGGYQTFEARLDPLLVTDPNERKLVTQTPGSMVFGSVRPTATLDLRDDPGRTRSGFYAQMNGDFMRSLADASFHVNLFKISGLAAGYVPLPLSSSLLLSVRGGYIFHLDAESSTPGDRRFYLGGALSLRGFPEDGLQPEDARQQIRTQIGKCQGVLTGAACTTSVLLALQGNSSGGDAFAAVRAEARIAITGNWELALFYDWGNLLANPRAKSLRDLFNLHDATGAGVRFATPIGRLSLDLGFNLHPDRDLGERVPGLYFSIDTL